MVVVLGQCPTVKAQNGSGGSLEYLVASLHPLPSPELTSQSGDEVPCVGGYEDDEPEHEDTDHEHAAAAPARVPLHGCEETKKVALSNQLRAVLPDFLRGFVGCRQCFVNGHGFAVFMTAPFLVSVSFLQGITPSFFGHSANGEGIGYEAKLRQQTLLGLGCALTALCSCVPYSPVFKSHPENSH